MATKSLCILTNADVDLDKALAAELAADWPDNPDDDDPAYQEYCMESAIQHYGSRAIAEMRCPKCTGRLKESTGYVGEDVLYCEWCGELRWEDSAGAIRRVI